MGENQLEGLRDKFRVYDDKLAALAKFSNHDPTERDEKNKRTELRAAAIIDECIQYFGDLRDSFDKLRKRADRDLAASTDSDKALGRIRTLHDQRCILCDVELIRLEILALVQFNYIIGTRTHLDDMLDARTFEERREDAIRHAFLQNSVIFEIN